MVQPLFIKFGGLVIKTLTKPLANQLKSRAISPGWIREACLQYGKFHHQIESRAILRLAGHQAKTIKPVADDAAVSIGATVFSEFFVFTVAGLVIFVELWKKSKDDEAVAKKKLEVAQKEKSEVERRFNEIELAMQAVKEEMEEMRRNERERRKTEEAASSGEGSPKEKKKKSGWL